MMRVFTVPPGVYLETRAAGRVRQTGQPVKEGFGFLVSRQARRYSSTASTRRDSLRVDGIPSLVKIPEIYFSAARKVTTRSSAMPWLEAPVAINSST